MDIVLEEIQSFISERLSEPHEHYCDPTKHLIKGMAKALIDTIFHQRLWL